MDSFIYDLVRTNQRLLSAEEQYDAALAIRQTCDRILELCYLHSQAREVIVDTLDRTGNLSKLGRDYNSHILGHNKSIHDKIDRIKDRLPKLGWIAGAILLVDANLHPRLVLNDEVFHAVKHGPNCWAKYRILAELAALQEDRELLVNCVLNAAADIAITKHRQLNNDVIQVSDLFQEALKAAYEGTLLYNYDSKAKWSSFAYSRMFDVISNFIADKSRVVSVPRSTIERFNTVVKAIQATKSIDPVTLMEHANRLVHNEKALAYSADEIETILKSMQANISLDYIIDDDNENGKHSLLDVLSIETETENNISKAFLRKNVGQALTKLLTSLEFHVVDLLWGITSGEPKDLNTTYEEIKAAFPEKKISKVRVRKTADKVLAKLRQNPELRSIWLEL